MALFVDPDDRNVSRSVLESWLTHMYQGFEEYEIFWGVPWVQWLGLHTFTAKGPGLIPGWITQIPQAVQCTAPRTLPAAKKKYYFNQYFHSHSNQTVWNPDKFMEKSVHYYETLETNSNSQYVELVSTFSWIPQWNIWSHVKWSLQRICNSPGKMLLS